MAEGGHGGWAEARGGLGRLETRACPGRPCLGRSPMPGAGSKRDSGGGWYTESPSGVSRLLSMIGGVLQGAAPQPAYGWGLQRQVPHGEHCCAARWRRALPPAWQRAQPPACRADARSRAGDARRPAAWLAAAVAGQAAGGGVHGAAQRLAAIERRALGAELRRQALALLVCQQRVHGVHTVAGQAVPGCRRARGARWEGHRQRGALGLGWAQHATAPRAHTQYPAAA